MRTFVLGGARSGKSSLAARWAAERSQKVCCVVTATDSDPEMYARIAGHRQQRPAHWRVREEPLHLGAAIREESTADEATLLLIDCLTLWCANCLWPPTSQAEPDIAGWRRESEDLIRALRACRGEIIIVSNEVGMGIVPESASARLFRDEQGWINQAIAAECDSAFLVAAGLPVRLKPSS